MGNLHVVLIQCFLQNSWQNSPCGEVAECLQSVFQNDHSGSDHRLKDCVDHYSLVVFLLFLLEAVYPYWLAEVRNSCTNYTGGENPLDSCLLILAFSPSSPQGIYLCSVPPSLLIFPCYVSRALLQFPPISCVFRALDAERCHKSEVMYRVLGVCLKPVLLVLPPASCLKVVNPTFSLPSSQCDHEVGI